ncbi:MAG: XrtA-associated tyrosine autokinase [Gammaproteobacteria bacterium]|nr:XrtA-associated tyrosine autokinase [Gammaproteobacteria bacterium]MDH5729906.1 XrtA-associated tyrosine autokinase [Gammaproteobacteria bacterium]
MIKKIFSNDDPIKSQNDSNGSFPHDEGAIQAIKMVQSRNTKSRAAEVVTINMAPKKKGFFSRKVSVGDPLIEEYRKIKRPIIEYAFKNQNDPNLYSNLVMVTSSVPGEGKTYTSVNLALSIAMELERTVLLVDADVIKPSINKFFNIRTPYGLNDYLQKTDADLSAYILKTSIENLRILPAGQQSMRSAELLSSEKMGRLVKELAERYPDRIIIFDSPPLLVTNEAPVISNLVGQIVVVVEAQKTTKTLLNDALSLLKKDKPINLVLNKSKSKSSNYGYGFDYYKK